MKDTTRIHMDILEKIEELADKIVGEPAEDIPELIEYIRSIVQQHIDMLYDEGHIKKKPEVTVEWNSVECCVETYLSWPLSCAEFSFEVTA